MTPKEALEIRENPTIKDVDNEELAKCIDEALEKQIPKKAKNTELNIYASGTRTLSGYCPVCDQPVSIFDGHQNNKKFRRDEDVFCSYCGQALDWSVINAK